MDVEVRSLSLDPYYLRLTWQLTYLISRQLFAGYIIACNTCWPVQIAAIEEALSIASCFWFPLLDSRWYLHSVDLQRNIGNNMKRFLHEDFLHDWICSGMVAELAIIQTSFTHRSYLLLSSSKGCGYICYCQAVSVTPLSALDLIHGLHNKTAVLSFDSWAFILVVTSDSKCFVSNVGKRITAIVVELQPKCHRKVSVR